MKNLFKNKLFLILALAAFLRLFLLSRVPISLNWDEISMGYTAYSVAQTGKDEWGETLPIFFRSYGEWKSAVYIYLLVPLVKFLGMNAWAVRLPSAFAGIISVYLVYLIGRRLYSEKVGLWSAFFMAVMPWSFVLSRPAFEANVSLTLILVGIHFFLSKNLLLSAVFFGLAPHTYNSAKFVVPFLVLYLLWQNKLYKDLKKSVLYLAVLVIFAIPILAGFVTGQSQKRFAQVGINTDLNALNSFIDNRKTLGNGLPAKLIFNRYTYGVYGTVKNWFSYFDPSFLVIEGGDHKQHHLPYRGVLYLTQFALIICGLFNFNKSNSLPLILIALGFVPAALTRDTHHVLRSILTTPGWALLTGFGAEAFYSTKSKLISWVNTLLIIEIITFMFSYFTWYPIYSGRDWQEGYQEVAAYLRSNEDKYNRIVMTKWYGEPQLFLAFYNNWNPVWYQEENRNNLHYESDGKIWLDQLSEYSIGKYSFKYINWQQDQNDKGALYIGKSDDFYPDSKVVKTINFSDGTPAFLLVEP